MVMDFRIRPREVGSQTQLIEKINAIFDELGRRLGVAEARVGSVSELETALRDYGQGRVNTALAPVLASIAAAADLGAILTARSETTVTVGTGVKTLFIGEAARLAFAPAVDLSIVSEADEAVAMLARRLSYNKATGELVVDVRAASGSGSHGPWTISPTASVETAGQVRTAPHGDLQGPNLAAQLEEIADALDARQGASATLSGIAALDLVANRLLATDENGAPILRPIGAFILDFLAAPSAPDARSAIGAAAINSPSFTGTPTAPTAQFTTNTTEIVNVTALRDAIASLSAMRVQVDIITATTSGIQPPSWAKSLRVVLIGGGGGGGSGRRGDAASDRCGGGGGAPGGMVSQTFAVADLAWPISITIGTGGAPGAARTANNTSGAPGADGLKTFITSGGAEVLFAAGGNGGHAGTNGLGSDTFQAITEDRATDPYAPMPRGAAGLAGSSPPQASSTMAGPSGGGGGAGIAASGSPGSGGRTGSAGLKFGAGRFAAAPAAVSPYAAGMPGVPKQWTRGAATGGNGGGSGNTTGSTPAGDGGAGGIPGGGGGGGGASTNGANSGAGGAGARGEAWIEWYG